MVTRVQMDIETEDPEELHRILDHHIDCLIDMDSNRDLVSSIANVRFWDLNNTSSSTKQTQIFPSDSEPYCAQWVTSVTDISECMVCRNCKYYRSEPEPSHGRTMHYCIKLKIEIPRDFSCRYHLKRCQMFKIAFIDEEMIKFSDGSRITFNHNSDCCEHNYADFDQLDDVARNAEFDTNNMIFEAVPNGGFRFGNPGKMFFVPCYSEQNGWYTREIDIYFRGKKVLSFDCESRYDD